MQRKAEKEYAGEYEIVQSIKRRIGGPKLLARRYGKS